MVAFTIFEPDNELDLSKRFKTYSNINLIKTTNEVMKLVTQIVPNCFKPKITDRLVDPFSDFEVLYLLKYH